MLNLPKEEKIHLRSDLDYYGASYVAADYCHLKKPLTLPNAFWQHGWSPDYWLDYPAMILANNRVEDKNARFWVARSSEEISLLQKGYVNAKAIGLPLVYLPEASISRKPNSLLVMPMHSLEYTKHKSWKFQEYVEEIVKIKKDFDEVLVCISPSCIKNGYWINEFSSAGFHCVTGANIFDKSALKRMQALMSSFEFITTNGLGSHIVYGAYFGAKVSIYGTFTSFQAEDHRETPFYQKYPEALELAIHLYSEEIVRKNYPFFFCEPIKATFQKKWADYEVGWKHKFTPFELKKLFEWDVKSNIRKKLQLQPQLNQVGQKVKTLITDKFFDKTDKHILKLLISSEYRKKMYTEKLNQKELTRLKNFPRYTATTTLLKDKKIKLVDAPSFLFLKEEIFELEIYKFNTKNPAPYIIDCGANIGLSVIYFKQQFPEAEILCFEPDRRVFEVLEYNLASFQLDKVTSINKALWNEESELIFFSEGADAGRIVEYNTENEQAFQAVKTTRLRTYLQRKVDFLKIDIEGAETKIIEDSADLLINVEHMFLEYHSFVQQAQTLDKILRILTKAGFRYYISHIGVQSPQPFLKKTQYSGMDNQLNIFLTRDEK